MAAARLELALAQLFFGQKITRKWYDEPLFSGAWLAWRKPAARLPSRL
jgi:hypothetical protein